MNDTHPEVERVHIELLRKAGPEHRVAMACALTDQGMKMTKAAIAGLHPELSPAQRDLFFIDAHYGKPVAEWIQ